MNRARLQTAGRWAVGSWLALSLLFGIAASAITVFPIAANSAAVQSAINLAFEGTKYCLAFGEDNVSGQGTNTWDIFGRFVLPSGRVLTNQITITIDPGAQRFPTLAFDGSNYLVSWIDQFGTTNASARFRFFDQQGQPASSIFSPFSNQGTNSPGLAAVRYDTKQYLAIATLGNPTYPNLAGEVYGAFVPSSAAPPSLSVKGMLTGGPLSLQLTGTPGINYAVEMTTHPEAATWTGLVTNSSMDGTFSFSDTQATNGSRFYRAVGQ